jgi:hypothetical protein
MKIQANRVDEFVKTFDNTVRGVLIYGPDTGLVSIRKNEVLQKVLTDFWITFGRKVLDKSNRRNILSN